MGPGVEIEDLDAQDLNQRLEAEPAEVELNQLIKRLSAGNCC